MSHFYEETEVQRNKQEENEEGAEPMSKVECHKSCICVSASPLRILQKKDSNCIW